jgi:hypothetical protein
MHSSGTESDASNEGIAKIAMIAKIAEIEKQKSHHGDAEALRKAKD